MPKDDFKCILIGKFSAFSIVKNLDLNNMKRFTTIIKIKNVILNLYEK